MGASLFSGMSVYDYTRTQCRSAARDIANLPDADFSGDLDAKSQKIALKNTFALPELIFAARKGRRLTENVRMQGGAVVQRTVIEVSIPFKGDQTGFVLSPSTQILGVRGSVDQNVIKITLADDDRLEDELASVVKVIETNLGHMAKDLETMTQEVRSAIDAAISGRKAELARRADLDNTRSFPIA